MYVLTVYSDGYETACIYPELTKACATIEAVDKAILEIVNRVFYDRDDLIVSTIGLKNYISTEEQAKSWKSNSWNYTQDGGWDYVTTRVVESWDTIYSVYHYCAQFNRDVYDDDYEDDCEDGEDINCFNGLHIAIVVQEFND